MQNFQEYVDNQVAARPGPGGHPPIHNTFKEKSLFLITVNNKNLFNGTFANLE